MRKIYKYEINPAEVGQMAVLNLPVGAEFKLFDEQHRKWCAWFEVNTQNESEARRFRVFATGEEIPSGYRYVSSFNKFVEVGSLGIGSYFCWHLYEI